MPEEIIEFCVERILPDEWQIPAMEKAIEERADNLPIIAPTPDGRPRPFELVLESKKLWQPGRTLRIRFLDGDPVVQAKVKQYAQQWTQHANIKFDFGVEPDADIRISFRDRGSWSFVGTDALSIPKEQPTMNFGWLSPTSDEKTISRVVLHEFGHALGCIHEHQHPQGGIPWDKEAVYRFCAGSPSFWSRAEVDQNIFQKYSTSQTQFSAFDEKSIMIYPISNQLTIGDFEVALNTVLSATDKKFIGQIYP